MANMADNTDRETIVWRGLWLNTILLSVGFGLCCGMTLLFITFLSLAVTGEKAGRYLNLLGVFMPGYRVSVVGAWVGFLWMFAYAAISGGVLYQLYMRAANGGAAHQGASDITIARLSGSALGLGFGALFAMQLFISSAWLIMRGTAAESTHAALLANYLPGYSVTWGGAAIGALWLFGYTAALSILFAFIYNAIAGARLRRRRPNV
jgi:hypothetical protein